MSRNDDNSNQDGGGVTIAECVVAAIVLLGGMLYVLTRAMGTLSSVISSYWGL